MVYNDINDEDFEAKVNNGKVAVVDFWAPWCGPCKMFGPVFEEVSEELSDLAFFKVNTDDAGDTTRKFNIRSVPTVVVFQNGAEVERFSGVFNKEQFAEKLKQFI